MVRLTGLLLIICSFSVIAEPPPGSMQLPEPPPLPEEYVQEAEENSETKADVTIRRDKKKVIEEYRINGRLYMVRITPKGGKPYYIKYSEDGNVIRGELEDIQTPYWKLFEW